MRHKKLKNRFEMSFYNEIRKHHFNKILSQKLICFLKIISTNSLNFNIKYYFINSII